MSDFRPIALCNTVYKIVTKIIANILKPISDQQSGFAPRRSIVESIIVAHEILHTARKTKDSCMTSKVDILKAYDMVDRDFLFDVLNKFGFCKEWLTWVTSCLSSPKFSVLVNGSSHGFFSLTRGIRQGDPLSPFLFIIMAEAQG